jgi:1,4-dihydroxy-2-naphthoate polyprenyltransferase
MYTPLILKRSWPEWAPGIGLGLLPVLGAYFVQSGSYTLTALAAAIPPGLLVHNLLLLNEFPDIEADKTVNKRTMPITLGVRNAAIVYTIALALVYIWLIVTVVLRLMPAFCLIGLLTLPLALKAARGAFAYPDMSKLVPGMANNVLIVLITPLLMGIGYVLARVF